MTTGVLIFAFNNGHYDYLAMANWSAQNIHRLLNLPVAVVTNVTDMPSWYCFDRVILSDPHGNNQRYFNDVAQTGQWFNGNRVDAFSISPWDTTIVLDADYVVASNQLHGLTQSSQDFLAHRWAYDITGQKTFESLNYFGQHRMPMWWATVLMFKKSTAAELIFDSMLMVRENWTHYRHLYKNSKSEYRSDHALTIAMNMVNGHVLPATGIPWDLATATVDCRVQQLEQDLYRFDFTTPDKQTRWIQLGNHDFHVLDKVQLGDIVDKQAH